MGAYFLYVTFGATLKAGQKTSKTVDLFVSEALICGIRNFYKDKLLLVRYLNKPIALSMAGGCSSF
jgi:hypothetical protein